MKTKTNKVTVAGTVAYCNLKQEPPKFGWRSYDRGRERYDIILCVRMRTDDGQDYWFYTPAADFSINTSGPFSISIIHPNDWIAKSKEKWDCEGVAGARGFGQLYEARIKVGDRIEVEGRVKKEGTRYGTLLNYIRRQDFNYDSLHFAWKKRCDAAVQSIPKLAIDASPPELPGVKWDRIGGYPRNWNDVPGIPSGLPDDHHWYGWNHKVESIEKLVSHVEGRPLEECQEPL